MAYFLFIVPIALALGAIIIIFRRTLLTYIYNNIKVTIKLKKTDQNEEEYTANLTIKKLKDKIKQTIRKELKPSLKYLTWLYGAIIFVSIVIVSIHAIVKVPGFDYISLLYTIPLVFLAVIIPFLIYFYIHFLKKFDSKESHLRKFTQFACVASLIFNLINFLDLINSWKIIPEDTQLTSSLLLSWIFLSCFFLSSPLSLKRQDLPNWSIPTFLVSSFIFSMYLSAFIIKLHDYEMRVMPLRHQIIIQNTV